MSANDHLVEPSDACITEAVEPASVALVPLARRAARSHPTTALPRPNSSFVAHLIATAEQDPQTRTLRRASSADAQNAYGARPLRAVAGRTRQII
jgi:hypothetical protein